MKEHINHVSSRFDHNVSTQMQGWFAQEHHFAPLDKNPERNPALSAMLIFYLNLYIRIALDVSVHHYWPLLLLTVRYSSKAT